MKTIKTVILAMLAASVLTSCKDFFIEKPEVTGMDLDDVFSTAKNAEGAIAEAYGSILSSGLPILDWNNSPIMPYETTVATCLGGNFLYAFDGTGQEEAACEFIKWFFEPENYIQYCKDGNYLPGVKGIEIDYEVPGLDIFVQELNATDAGPERDKAIESSYIGKDWGNTLRDNLARAVAGEISAEDVIRNTCNTILDTYQDLHE